MALTYAPTAKAAGELPQDSWTARSRGEQKPPGEKVSSPVRMLQTYVLVLFIIPTNTTLAAVGAAGFPAALIGIGLLVVVAYSTLMGTHNPLSRQYPTRWAFSALWLVSLASYVASQFQDHSVVERNGADRWLLFLLSLTGVAFMAAEGLETKKDVIHVLRAVVWGGAFCGFVAALQFWLAFDLSSLIGQSIPGFAYEASIGGIQSRGALNRVPGTTLHPIELGSVTAMVLPLGIALAIIDRERTRFKRVAPLILIALCIPVSVSRSAILAFGIASILFICQVDAVKRAIAFATLPVALVGVFLSIPGIITTLSSFFINAKTDTSVSTRTDDYPLVVRLVREHPLFGQGGGTYLPTDLLTILDNTYLKSAVEFGLIGLICMIAFYLLTPAIAAIVLRRRAIDEDVKLIAAAISAGLFASVISAATFDFLSFPSSTCMQALLIGLVGALWQITRRENRNRAMQENPAHEPDWSRSMDSLNIWRALRRNRWLVIGAFIVTTLAMIAVPFLKPETYRVQSSIVLMPPPAAPNQGEIEKDPSLSKVNTDNPYARSYDPTILIALVSLSLSSDEGKAALAKQGVDKGFTLTQTTRYGFASPFVDISTTSGDKSEALAANRTLEKAFTTELTRIQKRENFSQTYLITARDAGDEATVTATGSVTRLMLAVFIGGLIGMSIAVAMADATREWRRESQLRRTREARAVATPVKQLQ